MTRKPGSTPGWALPSRHMELVGSACVNLQERACEHLAREQWGGGGAVQMRRALPWGCHTAHNWGEGKTPGKRCMCMLNPEVRRASCLLKCMKRARGQSWFHPKPSHSPGPATGRLSRSWNCVTQFLWLLSVKGREEYLSEGIQGKQTCRVTTDMQSHNTGQSWEASHWPPPGLYLQDV